MQFREHRLANGMQVVAECNDAAHSAGYGFFVNAGARDEDQAVAGVSHFLEHMVFKGTPRRTAADVNREFDELGAHYNAYTTEEQTVYYAAVLPECQTDCLDLLADILRPSLREEDFATEKQVILEEIQMYDDQPPFGGFDLLKADFFGDHPLSQSVLGTQESVGALRVEQMCEYFQRQYAPNNIVLAAAGRVDFKSLCQQAESLCGDWQPAEVVRSVPRAEGAIGFRQVTRTSAAQQYVLQLVPGPSATDPDRFAAKVLATIVGDDSGSRIYWELVDNGRAEHASCGHEDYQGAGVTVTYMGCEPGDVRANYETLQAIYQEIETQGLTAEELQQAKNKVLSRIVLASERPRSRLFAVGGNWVYRHEYRSVQDDLQAVEDVSLEDVHAVLQRYPLSKNTTLTIGPLPETEWADGSAM